MAKPNETVVSYGTMDASGTALLLQVKTMIVELQNLGLPGVQPILDKYGFSTSVTSDLTSGFHIRSKDKTVFYG